MGRQKKIPAKKVSSVRSTITGKLIGEGANARVYAMKSQPKKLFKVQSYDDLDDLKTEILMSRRLAKANIAPKATGDVYDQVVHADELGYHGVVLERYQTDLLEFLNEYPANGQWPTMLDVLLGQMAALKILCMDVKPENVVLNHVGGRITSMRLIDFGSGWCAYERKRGQKQVLHCAMLIVFHVCHMMRDNDLSHSLESHIERLLDPLTKTQLENLFYFLQTDDAVSVWKTYAGSMPGAKFVAQVKREISAKNRVVIDLVSDSDCSDCTDDTEIET